MAEEVFISPKKRGRIAVCLSGRGSNFRAIQGAILAGKINAGLQIGRDYGLETLYLNPKLFPDREEYDKEVIREMRKRTVDLICLAGYMKILSPYFCREFRHRIMNIHPALLPSFPGLHVQKKALEWGVRYSGATVHFVAEEVDMGPIIIQTVVPVFQDDTEDTLADRILVEEHKIYPEAVRLYFEGRLEVRGRRVFIRES
ncbi:MAG: phosphoribosylglycinamide formyltransferase [Acidobacteriota bacterium]